MRASAITIQSGLYSHPELGDIRITVNGRARSIVARTEPNYG